MIIGQFWHNSP